ncbi:hypothetical protein Tco_0212665 [Tanacetum coccineum]
MRTRSQTRNLNRRQQQQIPLPVVVEPCNLEEPIPEQTIVANGGSNYGGITPCTTECEGGRGARGNGGERRARERQRDAVGCGVLWERRRGDEELPVVVGKWLRHEKIGFPSDDLSSGNPTLTSEPFTSEFTLEEIDAFIYDKSISLESDRDDCDPEEDIYVL